MPTDRVQASTILDRKRILEDFPILKSTVCNHRLVYLDSAASSLTPEKVVNAVSNYYRVHRANIHRGVHYLSQQATKNYESARKQIQKFVNAKHEAEVIFVRGTTEAINLVANSFGQLQLGEGDEVILSAMEHHANIVPWQMLRDRIGIKLSVIPMDEDANLDLKAYEKMLSERTKLVGLVHVSNALGTVNPVKEMIALAHAKGARVLIDGAQALPHMRVDVQDLDADFYAFSGHKICGPTGVGVLYGKKELLEKMPPYQGGGDMIESVTFEKTTYNQLPHKFEAGTPNISGGIGLGAATAYIDEIGYDVIAAQEKRLFDYAKSKLAEIDSVRFIGQAKEQASVISFTLGKIHPHDIGTILDQKGIAIRAGHHCAQPVMSHFGVPATARASFAFYNTDEDVDALVLGVQEVIRLFG